MIHGYPLGATLSLYDGWDKDRNLEDEDEKIYKGPQKGQAKKISSMHAVIVNDFRIINGVKCALCKLSNSQEVGYMGYLTASLEVTS